MIIYGHRGAKAEAPENTLASFLYAQDKGIRHIELDIRLSQDLELVVFHDKRLDKLTSKTGSVNQFTAAQLATIPITHGKDQPWPLQQCCIPSLAKVFQVTPEIRRFQLEVKPPEASHRDLLGRKLLALIKAYQLFERAIITSSDLSFLASVKQLSPDQPLGYVAASMYPNPIKSANKLNCTHLCLKHSLCKPNLVQKAHQCGLKLSLWTVNDVQQAKDYQRLGINSIITDCISDFLTAFG
jgi:glycerophosphoryl diester phosphodiesterase